LKETPFKPGAVLNPAPMILTVSPAAPSSGKTELIWTGLEGAGGPDELVFLQENVSRPRKRAM
jgi:hypothetical protein